MYPAGLVQRRELECLGERLNSIEINGTFYSLQSPGSFRKWAEQTPDGLVFTLKGLKFVVLQGASEEACGCACAAGEFVCVGAVDARAEAWAYIVAVPCVVSFRQAGCRAVPAAAPADCRRRGEAG